MRQKAVIPSGQTRDGREGKGGTVQWVQGFIIVNSWEPTGSSPCTAADLHTVLCARVIDKHHYTWLNWSHSDCEIFH